MSKARLSAQFKKLQSSMRQVVREWEKTISALIEQIEKREAVSVSEKSQVRSAKRNKGRRIPIKYRDKNGNTWTGRGRPARWIVEAEKAGKRRENFLVHH